MSDTLMPQDFAYHHVFLMHGNPLVLSCKCQHQRITDGSMFEDFSHGIMTLSPMLLKDVLTLL